MTNLVWPYELPLLIINRLNAKKKDAVIRTEMDVGPQKARRRYTVASKFFEGEIIVTEHQRRVLELFYDETLASGVLRFRMKDPQTLEFNEYRFAERYSEDGEDGLWRISLKLEKMNA